MNFSFSEEQQQLGDMLHKYINKEYSFDARRNIIESADGYSDAVWLQFAELGVLALTIPEQYGGLGGDAYDSLVIMQELGKGLVVEPYISSVVLGAGLISHAGSDQQKEQLLPAIAAGELKLALAQDEAASRYNMQYIETQAVASGDGWLLTGQKSVVLGGSSANKLIVSARTAGEANDANGVSLFVVDANADGVALKSYTNYDGQRAADIAFNGVSVSSEALLGDMNKALPVLAFGNDLAIAALCAEAVGIMDSLIQQTGEYLKTRKQFGVALGSFQALQHRMADMLMHAEQARSMSYLAASKVAAPTEERTRIMAAAKALIGQAARFVGQQAVQLHGGIGVTDELIISHYFKRLTLINASFGNADYHLGRFSDMSAAQAVERFAAA